MLQGTASATVEAVTPPDDAQFCPLLEYDPDPLDVVTAGLPATPRAAVAPRAVFAYLGSATARWATDHDYEQVTSVKLLSHRCPVYVGRHAGPRGKAEVTLIEMPLGAPASAMVADDAFRLGVRIAVATGSCGALVALPEGAFVVPTRALRDEGTSFHYAPPSRWIDLDRDVCDAVAAACRAAEVPQIQVSTWTTDAVFRETRAKVTARLAEGCQVVEMECAALAAVARHRGARFGQLLFTADTLAGATYDVRGLGRSARQAGLRLALDAVSGVDATEAPGG